MDEKSGVGICWFRDKFTHKLSSLAVKAHLKIGKVVNCQNILKDFNTKYKTEKKGVFMLTSAATRRPGIKMCNPRLNI
jgi:hypothetical protein